MKKFVTLWLTPIVSIIIILLKVPEVEALAKQVHANAVLFITIFLVAATIFTHAVTVISPYKKYEQWAKNRWAVLDVVTKPFVEKYGSQGFDIRVNLMVPRRTLLFFLHPMKIRGKEYVKPTLLGRIFKVVWSYGNWTVHKKLRISIHQGVCGKAYNSGDKVWIAEFVSGEMKVDTFGFSKKQKKITENLKFVASSPVFKDGNTPEQKNDKVAGVLNFEGNSQGSDALITDPDSRKQLSADIVSLSSLCSKFL